MTAKEFLLQVKKKQNEIDEQEEYIQSIRDSLSVAGIRYDKEPIQKTPDPNQRERLLIKLIDQEEILEKMKSELILFKLNVIDMIHCLDDIKHQKVLYGVYIYLKTLKDVADDIGYSYDYTRTLHSEALNEFNDKYSHFISHLSHISSVV